MLIAPYFGSTMPLTATQPYRWMSVYLVADQQQTPLGFDDGMG